MHIVADMSLNNIQRFLFKHSSVLVPQRLYFFLGALVRSGKGGSRKGDTSLSESFQRRNDHSQWKVHCYLAFCS